jgi:nitroreductase
MMDISTKNQAFETLSGIVSRRRTRKPGRMNGRKVPDAWIEELLRLADCAPTHGRTEPWRFFVLEGEGLRKFCNDHAQMYREHTPAEKWNATKYEQLKKNADTASHLVITVMKRSKDTKIPEREEYAATAAAVQNLLLGAEALGLAAIWSTGGMAGTEPMKAYWDLSEEDRVVAFVYLGFTDETDKTALRKIPLPEKIVWRSE